VSASVIPPPAPTVLSVFADLLRNPQRHLLQHWNWKSALLSVVWRSGIFFSAAAKNGLVAGLEAALHDAWFRFFLSGTIGTLTQSFRKAEPAWAATLTVSFLLPALAHLVEFTAHKMQGTANLKRGVIASIVFTVVSILFNYYAMRRGVLVVDEGRQSLWRDIQQMPRVVLGFLLVLPRWILSLTRASSK
jgi:hypothetical protein